ncbi:MAG: macro domain-containing protein, partial [Clostridia bacterium]|nr:macro domain-containing protein [Clostridia bacterium]
IDNCIHTFAGLRLRNKCGELMQKQGYDEPTGRAKITPAYNLLCDYVLHTVGPIVSGRLTDTHKEQLKSCYSSCLELAAQNGIKSIAFCCISTGVFGFPQKEAAEIAVNTVRDFLKTHKIEVIFNVFRDDDYETYKHLLGGN